MVRKIDTTRAEKGQCGYGQQQSGALLLAIVRGREVRMQQGPRLALAVVVIVKHDVYKRKKQKRKKKTK